MGVRDRPVYDDMEDLEGAMIQIVVATSLRDSSMVRSSGTQNYLTLRTDASTIGVTNRLISSRMILFTLHLLLFRLYYCVCTFEDNFYISLAG